MNRRKRLNTFIMNNLNNKVLLIGNVGADPDVKDLGSGKKLAKISLATNSSYVNKDGERVKDTQWHKVTMFGKTADVVEKYVTSGKTIAIEGKLNHKNYDDKDGNKKYVTEIVAHEVALL